MKLIGIILIAAMLFTGVTGVSVAQVLAMSADDFDAGGYDGAWTTVKALDVEIFLPDGWTGEDTDQDGACYIARSADGAASLTVNYPVDGAAGEEISANGKPATIVRGDDGSLSITVTLSENRLAEFRFDRTDEDALTEDLALQIAGSWTDVW